MARSVPAKPRIRVGTDGTLRGFAPAVPPLVTPRRSAEFMRGERANVFRSWHPFLRDAREDVRQAWWFSAARAVEYIQNSGYVSGLVLQAKASILGDGLQLVPRPDVAALKWTQPQADAWSAIVKPSFIGWAGNPLESDAAGKLTLHQQARAGVGSFFGPGEIVALMRWISRAESRTRTKVQLVPAHRLTQEANGIDLYQGIRIDPNGLPRGYRLRLPTPLLETGTILEWPARARGNRPIVVHVFDGEGGQMRGISPFAPSLGRMREFDHLTGGTLAAELTRALIAATVTSPSPTTEVLQMFDAPEEQGTSGNIDSYMGARSDYYDSTSFDLGGEVKIVHLFPGEELNLKTGGDAASVYDPLAQMLLREIAICSGHTVEEMTGDYRGASYSSIRIATSTRWPITLHRRKHIAAPLYQAAYECWLEEEIDSGAIPFPGGIDAFLANRAAACRADWRGPPKPQADDLKFAKATETLKRLGVITDERICGELGEDWEDVYAQLAEEKAKRQALGLPEPLMAGSTIIDEDDLDAEVATQGGAGDKGGGGKGDGK